MNKLTKVIDTIFSNDITLLAARALSGRTAITSEVLYQHTIKQNKNALIYSLDGDDTFYIINLLSKMTKIPRKEIASYYHPCFGTSKGKKTIAKDKLINSIERIQQSNLIINTDDYLAADVLDYLFEYAELEYLDLLIINNLNYLIKKSKYNPDEIFTKLKELSKKHHIHILLWSDVTSEVGKRKSNEVYLKDIYYFDTIQKYITNIILLNRNYEHEKYDIIELRNYSSLKLSQNLTLDYDKSTDTVEEVI